MAAASSASSDRIFRFSTFGPLFMAFLVSQTVSSAFGQIHLVTDSERVNLQVGVRFEDESSVGRDKRVELLSRAMVPIASTFTDDSGQATFPGVAPGSYYIAVRDPGVDQNTAPTSIIVSASRIPEMEPVRVRRSSTPPLAVGPPVSAAELRAPSKARSELTKAFSALKKNDFREAQDRLDRALKLYPSYAEAYNMLGNIYIQTGDKDKARSAFENAVRFDGKHAGANLSLGRLLIDQRQFAEAEVFSLNSTVASPENPDAWTVLALSQLLQDKLDDAIANAKRAHLLPHKGLAACHLIASGAYEKRGEFAAAAAELRTYLNENPAPSPKLVEHVKRLESLAR